MTVWGKIPADQQLLKYSKQPVWHHQQCHILKTGNLPFFLILLHTSAELNAEMHLDICVNDQVNMYT